MSGEREFPLLESHLPPAGTVPEKVLNLKEASQMAGESELSSIHAGAEMTKCSSPLTRI